MPGIACIREVESKFAGMVAAANTIREASDFKKMAKDTDHLVVIEGGKQVIVARSFRRHDQSQTFGVVEAEYFAANF